MTERPYRPSDLAEQWGCNKGAVFGLIRQGRLPAFAVGSRLWRVPAHAVDGITSLEQARERYPCPKRLPERAEDIAQLMRRTINATDMDGGFVYFMRCREIVKVGYSIDPGRRLLELQALIPFDVELMGYLPASAKAERALHQALSSIRHGRLREWFILGGAFETAVNLILNEGCEAADG